MPGVGGESVLEFFLYNNVQGPAGVWEDTAPVSLRQGYWLERAIKWSAHKSVRTTLHCNPSKIEKMCSEKSCDESRVILQILHDFHCQGKTVIAR